MSAAAPQLYIYSPIQYADSVGDQRDSSQHSLTDASFDAGRQSVFMRISKNETVVVVRGLTVAMLALSKHAQTLKSLPHEGQLPKADSEILPQKHGQSGALAIDEVETSMVAPSSVVRRHVASESRNDERQHASLALYTIALVLRTIHSSMPSVWPHNITR